MKVEINSTNKRRLIGMVTTAVIVAALLITGTFAFVLPYQHRSNLFAGSGNRYDVTLNERFYPPRDWTTEDGPVVKQINVANTGANAQAYGEVFVRINLREFMEITIPAYYYWTPEGGMVSGDNIIGNAALFMTVSNHLTGGPSRVFVVAPDVNGVALTEQEAREWFLAHPVYGLLFPDGIEDHDLLHTTDYVSGKTGWYVISRVGDLHGQYGRYMVATVVRDSGNTFLVGSNTPRALYVDYGLHQINGECSYDLTLWNATLPEFEYTTAYRQWIRWNLGVTVVTLSQWIEEGAQPIDAWIIDDRPENTLGWIYWGNPLGVGEHTTNFLESVELLDQPQGDFHYVIHTHMYGVSLEGLSDWTDMPPELEQAFRVRQ